MHKYQPRIHLIMRRDPNTANLPITDLESESYRTFVFPETVFTAVTAYQNQLVSVDIFLILILINVARLLCWKKSLL